MSEQTAVACGTYTLEETAIRLGVSLRTVKQLRRDKKLPMVDLGLGVVRVSAATIDRIVDEGGTL